MNRNGIKRLLRQVHNEWAKSIEDEKVRNLVNQHSIITGGSIASLLMGEKVNDFDVYFTDFETAVAVASYYCKMFKKLNPNTKIKPKVKIDEDVVPKRIRIYVKSIGFCSEKGDAGYKYFEQFPDNIGNDFVESRFNEEDSVDPPTDQELDEEELEETPDLSGIEHDGSMPSVIQGIISAADEVSAEALQNEPPQEPGVTKSEKPKYRPIFMTSNAITLSNKIQLVTRFYGTPEEIHSNYDFTHCTNYWLSGTNELVLRPEAMECLLAKELRYQGSKYPLCSIIRTRKFIRRGYSINAGQYLKMCFQLSELDLTNVKVLEDQLTGVDTAYFTQLIERCKRDLKSNPETGINSTYIVSLVDHMF
jgi:hypothetical protein